MKDQTFERIVMVAAGVIIGFCVHGMIYSVVLRTEPKLETLIKPLDQSIDYMSNSISSLNVISDQIDILKQDREDRIFEYLACRSVLKELGVSVDVYRSNGVASPWLEFSNNRNTNTLRVLIPRL